MMQDVKGGELGRLKAELVDAVLLARVAPGRSLSLRDFAALGRSTEAKAAEVLPDLVAAHLVSFDGRNVVVSPVDKDAMFASLPRRMELEIRIVRAATLNASQDQIAAMQASEAMQSRCAKVGDMDGLMHAERQLEALLVEASGLFAEGAELVRIKRDFRRAWCAANRLKNFTNVANIRTALVAAIASRDADAAEAQVRVFFDHLMRSY